MMRSLCLALPAFALLLWAPSKSDPKKEVDRVHAHFDGALQMLKDAETSQLSAQQRARRAALTRTLQTYQARRLYPKNRDTPIRTPYFVDEEGTRCALAYLMESTGEHALVEQIRTTRNTDLAIDLSDDPKVRAWLDTQGLSIDEAARIQPSYDFDKVCIRESSCLCFEGTTQVARATVVSNIMTMNELQGFGPFEVGETKLLRNTPQPGTYFVLLEGEEVKALMPIHENEQLACRDRLVPLDVVWNGYQQGDCRAALIEHDRYYAKQTEGCDEGGCTCATPKPSEGASIVWIGLLGFAVLLGARRYF